MPDGKTEIAKTKSNPNVSCEFCKKNVRKSSLKCHYNSRYCISERMKIPKSTVDCTDFLPDCILSTIFWYAQKLIPVYGVNIFSILRLTCKRFDYIVRDDGKYAIVKSIGNKSIMDFASINNLDAYMYMMSINRYIGTKRCLENFQLTSRLLETLRVYRALNGMFIINLYRKTDIIVSCLKKYGSMEAVLGCAREKNMIKKRREEFINELAKYNMKVSKFNYGKRKLYNKYIHNTFDENDTMTSLKEIIRLVVDS